MSEEENYEVITSLMNRVKKLEERYIYKTVSKSMFDDLERRLADDIELYHNLGPRLEKLEKSKDLALSYKELSKREFDSRIQELKKELKELKIRESDTYKDVSELKNHDIYLEISKERWENDINSYTKSQSRD
jgi:hypothetical protein